MSSSSRTASASSAYALSDSDRSRYAIARAILAAADEAEDNLNLSNCFELGISAEIERRISDGQRLMPQAQLYGLSAIEVALLVSERFDRIQLRGFSRRVISEENSDPSCKQSRRDQKLRRKLNLPLECALK